MKGGQSTKGYLRCLDKIRQCFYCSQYFQSEIFLACYSFAYIGPMKRGLLRWRGRD